MTEIRIAVVTPYYREPLAYLEQCHRSVKAQDVTADHIMVADGHARDEIDAWDVRHVRLPMAHGDDGNTPRAIGGILARAEGYDFVAYLDGDNWYHKGHLASLIELWRAKRGPIVASLRTFHEIDGTPLPVFETDENALKHVDTSCYLIHRDGFSVLSLWSEMPRSITTLCDRVFFAGLLHRRFAIHSTGKRTVAYRTPYAGHYRAAKRPVPADAKDSETFAATREFLRSPEGVSQCVRQLGFWPPTYIAI